MRFYFIMRRHPSYTLFPYTTLFRSPSQLYVFMPPNLGGFFMVRSYYPSECHADYFDFERIEAQSQNNQRDIRSEERFSRNAETDLVCRLLLEKKKKKKKVDCRYHQTYKNIDEHKIST